MATTDAYPDQVTFAPGPASRYEWVAAGPHPCPRCAELDGQIRTIETWQASVNPGFHKNCRCFLRPVDLMDSGTAFTDQFTHICMADLLNCISAIFRLPGPIESARSRQRHRAEDAEGAEDIMPYVSPTRDTPTTEYDNSEGGDQYSNRGV